MGLSLVPCRPAALRLAALIIYVASTANIADLPPRGALAEVAALLARFQQSFSLAEAEVSVILPDLGKAPEKQKKYLSVGTGVFRRLLLVLHCLCCL